MTIIQDRLFKKIEENIIALPIGAIPEERKALLEPLVDYIQSKLNIGEEVRLNFICTHKSRRSHLSQVWAQTMAAHFKIPNVYCYSGGTEASALFPMAAKTLERMGFEISKLSEESNPVYSVKFAEKSHPVIGFSKTYDNDFNPKSNFGAIMTCSQADVGCPFIAGADKRFPITFEDPKAFDNTPEQEDKYRERSIQIATELGFVFSKINKNDN